ncbi:hypothetical protein LTR62_005316 [Meristemomyces frigidus]|uniref:TauD/TfdA-like domain-containing protein n=1 Tax=Meristemomyces frigidus TaxID=1508187 RepID=A0AAN7YFI8_9PEZI|nr:hypothetical protein LTR62_005316 [Meristemomyces frigidus]
MAVGTEKTTWARQYPPLYPDYLPFYDPLEKIESVGPFEHHDLGLRADPQKANLLRTATAVNDLSPHCGTELVGVQLDELNSAGLNELALMCAERGCLVFRDQKFTNIGFEAQKRIAEHFGPLHKHGWMPHPQNGPAEFVIVYDSKDDLRIRNSWKRKNPVQFHVDQSPEAQPPGATFFCMLESPAGVGGDTGKCSVSEPTSQTDRTANRVLSIDRASLRNTITVFRKRLEGLWAVHSTQKPISRELRDNGNSSVLTQASQLGHASSGDCPSRDWR